MEQTNENKKVDDFCEAIDQTMAKNKADQEKKVEEAIRRNDLSIEIDIRKSEDMEYDEPDVEPLD